MIITDNLYIRYPEKKDSKLLKEFAEKNQTQLKEWNAINQLTQVEDWLKRIHIWEQEHTQDKSVRFLLLPKDSNNQLLGICNYTNIIRGTMQACHLGFLFDQEHCAPELIYQALQTTIEFMFQQQQMHRIMANYQPHNHAAGQLLKSLGFRVEGFAYDYMLTSDGWKDCILSSIINDNWKI